MSKDDTNNHASKLGYPVDTATVELILGAARLLRRDVTTRSTEDALYRLLALLEKASRFDETMRALVEGDEAHAAIVRGLRTEAQDRHKALVIDYALEIGKAYNEVHELREKLEECTATLLSNQQALEEATEVITANAALMLDGRDVVADASTTLADALVNSARYEAKFAEALFERDAARAEQDRYSKRISDLAKAHNEVVLSYERELTELRREIAELRADSKT